MVRTVGLIGLALAAASASGQTFADDQAQTGPGSESLFKEVRGEVAPGRLLVRTGKAEARELETSFWARMEFAAGPVLDGEFVTRIGRSGWTLWRIDEGLDPVEFAKRATAFEAIDLATPAQRVFPLLPEPNDPDWRVMENDPELIIDFRDDPYRFRRVWHLEYANAEAAWNHWPGKWYSASDMPVDPPQVAVIDTGIDLNHPDFINAGGSGIGHLDGGQIDLGLSRQFSAGQMVPPENGVLLDANGHGTSVMGVIGAAGNNGEYNGHGTIGMAYMARGIVLRVFENDDFGTDAEAAAAIFYAADNGIEVANLSLGTPSYSQLLQDAVTYATQKGTLVVAAAGNNQLDQLFYPAAASGALGVGGLDLFGNKASYANSGAHVDVSAASGDLTYLSFDPIAVAIQAVWTTAPTYANGIGAAGGYLGGEQDYAYILGTSFASPTIAGIAAYFAAYHGLNTESGYFPVRAHQAILRGAQNLNGLTSGTWDGNSGYGMADAYETLFESNRRGATGGAIEGRLYDVGSPFENESIVATRLDDGRSWQTTSQDAGVYRFQLLPAGDYEISATVRGVTKTIQRKVVLGADVIGADLWVGGAPFDDTPPTVARLEQVGDIESDAVNLRIWTYDTETSIDRDVVEIGTGDNLSDVMAPVELIRGNTDGVRLEGLPEGVYTLTLTTTNGAGLERQESIEIQVGDAAPALSGSITMEGHGGSMTGLPLHVELRTPGTTTALESKTVQLNEQGEFRLWTNRTGTFDVAVKTPFGLRAVSEVTLTEGETAQMDMALLTGDVDGDNAVSRMDYLRMMTRYGWTSDDVGFLPWADLDGDGTIDRDDAMLLRENLGQIGAR